MARGPVDKKNIALESYYGDMNIHLELLHKALLDKNEEQIGFQKFQLDAVRNALEKLGYFGKGK